MKEKVMCENCSYCVKDDLPPKFWCDNFDVVVDENDFCSMGIEKDGTESQTLTEAYFSESVGKMDALFDIYGVRED
jgi:hypothetical protein